MLEMKKRLTFYLVVAALVVVDSILLRSPSLLGKIGLIIYKYHYLRTFPKTLLTVSIVVLIVSGIAELIRLLVKLEMLKRMTGVIILSFLLLATIAILIKTAIDFSAWTYSHTGMRFRYGAYLLPCIMMTVFAYNLFTLKERHEVFPESPIMEEDNEVQ